VSTTALLFAQPDKLVCYDMHRYPQVDVLQALAGRTAFVFHQADVLQADIEETDLIFIDTWHVCGQLKEELRRHAGKVRQYIVLHDTTTFRDRGETPGHAGLWPAVEEFLALGAFRLKHHYDNNNGLTILERITSQGLASHWEDRFTAQPSRERHTESAAHLYLDLMKKCLTNWIHGDREEIPAAAEDLLHPETMQTLTARGIRLVQPRPFDPQLRAEGRDWPPSATASTMIGLRRLDNLQYCIEDVLANNVPGDLLEAGAWRGGATIFMRAILKAYGVTDRCVWAADSFEGLPPPDPRVPQDAGDPHHTYQFLAVPLEEVQANFGRYGLLDDQVRFLKGWFRDTLPRAPVGRLAVLRLDGDMYESTMDALVPLYPKLSPGGYLIVDDYALPGCRQAVQDFRAGQGITEEMRAIDWTGVFWQRLR